jgi:integrase
MVLVVQREDSNKPKYQLTKQETTKSEAGTGRTIPLNDAAYNALLSLKEITGHCKYVLAATDDTPIRPDDLDKRLRRLLVAAGFPHEKVYGLHSLRHTFATILLSHKVDIKTVSKLLGHSDVTVTYNTYIHVIKEQEKAAVEMIPELY